MRFKNRSHFFVILLFAVLFIVPLIAVNYVIYGNNYDSFIDFVVKATHKERWVSFFKKRVDPDKFQIFRTGLLLLDAVALIAFLWVVYEIGRISRYLKTLLVQLKVLCGRFVLFYKELPKNEAAILYIILSFVFFKAVIYIFYLPMQYDEMWIYSNCTKNGFMGTFVLPINNHRIYTLIATIFNQLPGPVHVLVRLPNAFTGILLLLFFYPIIKKFFSFPVSIAGLAFFATSVPVGMYMVIAKSYIYVLFFAVLLFWIYNHIFNRSADKLVWFLLPVTMLLGYWGNPSFFFAHVFLTAIISIMLLIKKEYRWFNKLILYHLFAAVFIFLLYLPDILGGHFTELMNAASRPQRYGCVFFSVKEFNDCINKNSYYLTGINNSGVIVSLMIVSLSGLIFAKKISQPFPAVASIFCMVVLPFWSALTGQAIIGNVAIYIILYFTIILLYLINFILAQYKVKRVYLFLATLLIISVVTIAQNEKLMWHNKIDKSAKAATDLLIKNNVKTILLAHFYYKPAIEYYYNEKKLTTRIKMPYQNSLDYENYKGDCSFDAIILRVDSLSKFRLNECYKIIYEDSFIRMLKKQ
jgi:hypothetical protein